MPAEKNRNTAKAEVKARTHPSAIFELVKKFKEEVLGQPF
jgi:hypothetical protein